MLICAQVECIVRRAAASAAAAACSSNKERLANSKLPSLYAVLISRNTYPAQDVAICVVTTYSSFFNFFDTTVSSLHSDGQHSNNKQEYNAKCYSSFNW